MLGWLAHAGPGRAESPAPEPPPRVALVSVSADLAEAIKVALSGWDVAVEEIDGAALAGSMPGTADAARAVAGQTKSDSVVWISVSDSGSAVWVYDRATDRVTARRLPGPPPYDEPTAAAVALSIKTLLRHSRGPAPPRGETVGDVALPIAPPETPPPRALRLSASAALAGRIRRRAPDSGFIELGLELERRGLFVSARIGVGLPVGGRVVDDALEARLSSHHGVVLAGGAQPISERLAVSAALGIGAALTRLAIESPAQDPVSRINPTAEARLRLSFELGAGLEAGLEAGLTTSLRRQRFEFQGQPVLTMPRAEGLLSAALRLDL